MKKSILHKKIDSDSSNRAQLRYKLNHIENRYIEHVSIVINISYQISAVVLYMEEIILLKVTVHNLAGELLMSEIDELVHHVILHNYVDGL